MSTASELPHPVKGWQFPPDPLIREHEQREIREHAVSHAVCMHGDVNVTFERAEAVVEVLKTAQEFYDWIVNGGTPR